MGDGEGKNGGAIEKEELTEKPMEPESKSKSPSPARSASYSPSPVHSPSPSATSRQSRSTSPRRSATSRSRSRSPVPSRRRRESDDYLERHRSSRKELRSIEVSGLTNVVKESHLEYIFGQYGTITNVTLPINRICKCCNTSETLYIWSN
jgi:RNA recognition motif-containing protein